MTDVPLTVTIPGQSVTSCTVGLQPTSDVESLKVYGQFHGGAEQLLAVYDVTGMEGSPYDFVVSVDPGPWSFQTAATDTAGNESCRSGTVTLTVTAVELPIQDFVSEARLYDVHGRRVHDVASSGVYFQRRVWATGREETRKVVVIR